MVHWGYRKFFLKKTGKGKDSTLYWKKFEKQAREQCGWTGRRLCEEHETQTHHYTPDTQRYVSKATFTWTRAWVRVSVYGSFKLHPHEWSVCGHLYKHITQRMSINNLQWNQIVRMLCKTVTIFYYIVNNFTNRAPLIMNNSTVTKFVMSKMHHGLYKLN